MEWMDWHLTPRGWKPGSFKANGEEVTGEAPTDRVQTVRFHERHSSPHRQSDGWTEIVWESEDEKLICELHLTYGPPPV
jgi:hypothetical protein